MRKNLEFRIYSGKSEDNGVVEYPWGNSTLNGSLNTSLIGSVEVHDAGIIDSFETFLEASKRFRLPANRLDGKSSDDDDDNDNELVLPVIPVVFFRGFFRGFSMGVGFEGDFKSLRESLPIRLDRGLFSGYFGMANFSEAVNIMFSTLLCE